MTPLELSSEGARPERPEAAFEPIVDVEAQCLLALRAPLLESLMQVPDPLGLSEGTLWRLARDREYRRAALLRAVRSGWEGSVHVPMLAASAEDNEVCSMALAADARTAGIRPERIVLELSETEQVANPARLASAVGVWRSLGFRTATRHFGGGMSGMAMLLRLEPNIICLDGDWIRRVPVDSSVRVIVAGVVNTCRELGVEVIADGVISHRLSLALQYLGVRAQSGSLFTEQAALPSADEDAALP